MIVEFDLVIQALYLGMALLVLSVLLAGCAAIIGHGIHQFKNNREGVTREEEK